VARGQQLPDRLGQLARVEPAGLERLAAPAALALEHLVGLVLVEVGARRGDPVHDEADRQHRQEGLQHEPGDQDQREQHHVEGLHQRVGDQGSVELGTGVGMARSLHQKKLEMLR
jgi:hypothetical protein